MVVVRKDQTNANSKVEMFFIYKESFTAFFLKISIF